MGMGCVAIQDAAQGPGNNCIQATSPLSDAPAAQLEPARELLDPYSLIHYSLRRDDYHNIYVEAL